VSTPLKYKSTLEEIRSRFDHDVERFSNLETGQQATIDAQLVLELVAKTCARHVHSGGTVLDLGCGAGNFTLRVLQEVGGLNCHLVDLSRPMLKRAEDRLRQSNSASVVTHQSDLRTLSFTDNSFELILAGAVLHHLRDEEDWRSAFTRFHAWLKPGGRIYVADLCTFDLPDVQAVMWQRYADYLVALGGEGYYEMVLAYIDKEDSPRWLPFSSIRSRPRAYPTTLCLTDTASSLATLERNESPWGLAAVSRKSEGICCTNPWPVDCQLLYSAAP
jgi:tRNA (cmo5U34)-methyltransferase